MTNNVLIYANKIARPSETFIFLPALAMKRYVPYFVGSRREHSFSIPEDRIFLANGQGRTALVRQRLKTALFGHNGVAFLANQLRPLKPRLLQAHFGPESINALPLAKALSIPFIIYYHGIDATLKREYALQNRFLRTYLKRLPTLQKEATLVLTQSDFLRDKVIELGYPPEKVRTHYIGVEPAKEDPLPHEARKPIVLFVARLVEKKGATYLMSAMQIVQQTYPELELVLVGDGSDKEQLIEQAQNQLRNFRFLGWQSHEKASELMREALIFSVPSVTAENGDSEGFGMVFIEAQRFGTPVVSSLHGGIVESVADGETGLLVPERNVEALADAIKRIYEDSALWQRLSSNGYERTKRKFNIHSLVSDLETIYDEIASN